MSGDMRPYVVRQGDYLVKLAFVHGFDAEEVWNDAKNEEIRGKRGDHNILAPGDIVYLPVKEKEGFSIVKGATNKYTAKVPKITVHLVIKDEDGQALVGESYEIRGLGEPVRGTVGDGGAVSFEAPVTLREATFALLRLGIVYPVRVGDLDPIEDTSGVRMRLAHLGHLRSPDDDDRESMARAILAFQKAQKMDLTGVLDEATRDALKTAHGS